MLLTFYIIISGILCKYLRCWFTFSHLGRDLAASIQFPIHFHQEDNADYTFMYLIWNHLNFSMI